MSLRVLKEINVGGAGIEERRWRWWRLKARANTEDANFRDIHGLKKSTIKRQNRRTSFNVRRSIVQQQNLMLEISLILHRNAVFSRRRIYKSPTDFTPSPSWPRLLASPLDS